MANDECLTLLDKKLSLKVQEQLLQFGKQVRAITYRAIGKGSLGGPAIQEVIDLRTQILRSRVDYILKTLESLPFKYSNNIGRKISDICLKYFPSDFGEFSSGIEEIIRVAHGNRPRDEIVSNIKRANITIIQQLRNELDIFLLNLKIMTANQISDFEKWAGAEYLTLAIVFTDLVGSTALGQELGGELMERVRQAHFEQTRQSLKKYGGCEIKTMGDGFMVAFRNVANALDFAIELYSNTGHPKIKIRASIHIGPVQIKENDAHGDTVNYADRVKSSIEGAEIRMSNRSKEDLDLLCADRHHNLGWRRLEGIEMKGFPGKHILWLLEL